MEQEQKAKARIREDVTPYGISVYLKEVHGVTRSGNRIYGDRKHGLLKATKRVDPTDGREKWFVKPDEAMRYVDVVLGKGAGGAKKKAWW